MLIGGLAKRCGVPVQTIRYYERIGILLKPPRGENGYRIYSDEEARRVRFVRQAQSLGFSLQECRQILELRRRHKRPCDEVIRMTQGHLERVSDEIVRLRRFQRRLQGLLKRWRGRGPQPRCSEAICDLIEGAFPAGLDLAPGYRVQNPTKKGVRPCEKPC
jgi:DNA-binding transcriptional MerR regulator